MTIDPCQDCGLCCEHLVVEADVVDVLREPRIQELRPLKNVHGRLSAHEACWILAGPGMPCIFLTPEKRCSVHPTRPHVCVAFLAGSDKCQELRRDHGLPPAPVQPTVHGILEKFIAQVIAEEGGEPG